MVRPLPASRRALVVGALLAVLAGALPACRNTRSTPAPRGAPPPSAGPLAPPSGARLVSDGPAPVPAVGAPAPAPPGEAKSIDELLAIVEGEVITRGRIVKMIGARAPEEDERAYERKIFLRLLRRARTSVIVKAAQRFGLSVQPDVLDRFVVDRAKEMVALARATAEKAVPGSGATITFERLLVESGQSMEDFRAECSDEMLTRNYFSILSHGVPGKRPQLDIEPSPQDIRRLYDAHRDRFDVQPGVRYALWVAKPTDFFGQENRTYEQAKEMATRALGTALAQYRTGKSAKEVEKANGLADSSESPAGKWAERGIFKKGKAGQEVEGWLFDPARVVGDSRLFDFDDPLAMVVVELRPARQRAFDEVSVEVANLIRSVRRFRFEKTHTLELLGRATISPQRVFDELQAQARGELRELDDDELTRDVRLR